MIYDFRLTIYESVVAVTAIRKSEIKNRKSLVFPPYPCPKRFSKTLKILQGEKIDETNLVSIHLIDDVAGLGSLPSTCCCSPSPAPRSPSRSNGAHQTLLPSPAHRSM